MKKPLQAQNKASTEKWDVGPHDPPRAMPQQQTLQSAGATLRFLEEP